MPYPNLLKFHYGVSILIKLKIYCGLDRTSLVIKLYFSEWEHPPTLSQLGIAAIIVHPNQFFENRQPRTLVKEGHIESLKRLGEKNPNPTQNFNDEDNLTRLATVSASSTWYNKNIQELIETGMATDACLIQFPITSNISEIY